VTGVARLGRSLSHARAWRYSDLTNPIALSRLLVHTAGTQRISAFFGTWSCDGSCDDLDPVWSHDLPTVTWSGTSGVTTSVRDKVSVTQPALQSLLREFEMLLMLWVTQSERGSVRQITLGPGWALLPCSMEGCPWLTPSQSLCIMRFMHYSCMHYENFYCTSLYKPDKKDVRILMGLQYSYSIAKLVQGGSLREDRVTGHKTYYAVAQCHYGPFMAVFPLPLYVVSTIGAWNIQGNTESLTHYQFVIR
jgi:hypothetical protein